MLINTPSSKTHLLYIASFLAQLKGKFDIQKIYIRPSGQFLNFKGLLDQDITDFFGADWSYLKENSRLSFRFFFNKKKKNKTLYYLHISDCTIQSILCSDFVSQYKEIRNVIICEGIGSSGNLLTRFLVALREQKKFNIFIFIRKIITKGILSIFFKKVFLKVEQWQLYNQNLELNPEIKQYILVHNHYYQSLEQSEQKAILFIGQPWVELGFVEQNTYINFLQSIIDGLIKKGYYIKLRPHPAEGLDKYEKLNIQLDQDYSLPLELLFDQPYIVIGNCSTALINLSAIFGVDAYLLKCDFLENLYLSKTQKALFAKYCGSELDLEQLLDKLH
ncbi:polysialyltransferase family glycosyltransferase [Neisseria sp. Ec49-e6-T10]|uniref:polysialyltransferase family glycosyltransferase n=1 Tax=Neisseria sp. Ec49-e6-T10 TaxID=3140744 RepID=UPI003EB82D1D